MTAVIFRCKTCGSMVVHDVYSELFKPTYVFNHIHKKHDISIEFKNDIELRYLTRPMTKFISFRYKSKPLTGVEIGVKYGDNAFNILNGLNIKKLYLIDPYKFYDEYDKSDFKKIDPKKAFESAKTLLNPYNNKIEFICDYSSKATDMIPNNLDFVYVDGNHSYEYVMKDLELYYKKLKIGGIIGGHDFGLHTPDVLRAVSDFIYKNKLESVRSENIDFWIIKDKEI